MSIEKIESHLFDYDNLRDVNLSPTMERKFRLTRLNGQGLCTITVRDCVELFLDEEEGIFEHPFNRGLGNVYHSSTTSSIETGFSKLAFGLVTAAIIDNSNDDPEFPDRFLMLADAHNRLQGLIRAFKAGSLSDEELRYEIPLQIIPASQFIEIYGLLNTCRQQGAAEKYTHPVLRYGASSFKLAKQAGLDTIDKKFAPQLAYLVEYYETKPIGQDTYYADIFDARTQCKPRALKRAADDPVVLPRGKEQRLVGALQWLEAVKNNVDKNLGGKLLANSPFQGMLLVWFLRNEPKLGKNKSASRFATKLNKWAFDLKPWMSCITHSGESSIKTTETEILKIL